MTFSDIPSQLFSDIKIVNMLHNISSQIQYDEIHNTLEKAYEIEYRYGDYAKRGSVKKHNALTKKTLKTAQELLEHKYDPDDLFMQMSTVLEQERLEPLTKGLSLN